MNLKGFKYYELTLIIYYQRNLNICIELKGKKLLMMAVVEEEEMKHHHHLASDPRIKVGVNAFLSFKDFNMIF